MANYTILLIDYEPRSIERFRGPLVGAGYSVELASDGVSGMEAFHRLNPDMVIVEAMIPKKHGFEVCQELKRTPHGRQTPVIITTGVYKGRKYRTQALHIYGCDEYIEKPIAPEQLLEIVGRFLAPGGSAAASDAANPRPVTSRSGDRPIDRQSVDAMARPTSSVENDDREDEITARLDALLSGKGPANPSVTELEHKAVATAVAQDPFMQLRAELDAEFGGISTPLAFETAPTLEPTLDPLVSDQIEALSVLDTLPLPPVEEPAPARTPSAPTDVPKVVEEQPGQVVNFETKRSRKGMKSSKQSSKRPPEAAAIAPPVLAVPAVPVLPIAETFEPVVPGPELTLPSGTMLESEIETTSKRGGMPVWAWAAVVAIALVGIYFVIPRGSSSPSVPAPTSKLPATTVAPSTPVAIAPPVTTQPAETKTPTEAATSAAPTQAPVVAPAKMPAPAKRIDPIPAPSATLQPNPPAAESATPEPRPAAIAPATPTAPETTVAGVESVPEPTTPSTRPAIARGALIPLDVADTMPIAIQHKLPIYSAAARQLRLSGTVIMNVLVNERGTVDQVVLVSGVPGADLNDAAMGTAKAWTYRPATKNGVPVKVWKSEQIVFKP